MVAMIPVLLSVNYILFFYLYLIFKRLLPHPINIVCEMNLLLDVNATNVCLQELSIKLFAEVYE